MARRARWYFCIDGCPMADWIIGPGRSRAAAAAAKRQEALRDLNISRAVMLDFRSISNHVTFHSHRDDVDRLPALLREEMGWPGSFRLSVVPMHG